MQTEKVTGRNGVSFQIIGTSTQIGAAPLRLLSSRPYRLGVSQARKAKESGDERPRLRAS